MFKGVWKKCLSSDPEKSPVIVNDIPDRLNQSLTYNRQRRIHYKVIGVLLGITAIAVCIFLIYRKEHMSIYGKQQDTATISEASGLKELMNQVMNDVEITEEERQMLDSMSYKLGKAAFDCGNWLIEEARCGGIKGADHAQWADYHL